MQKNSLRSFAYLTWVLLLASLLSGCGNRFEEQLTTSHNTVQSNLKNLKTQLDTGRLSNALLIEHYATALAQQKPEYTNIADVLTKEASSRGALYNALNKRLAAVNLRPANRPDAVFSMQELQLINAATSAKEFNNSLIDVVNTLAALSDDQLPAISAPGVAQGSEQAGNALIGNPAYGNWQQGSGGQSFWAWYGMYAMFNNVMGMNRPAYGGWSSRPDRSYYGSVGRNRWGSNTDVSRQHDLSQRQPSRYNKPTAASKARYAKVASRASRFGGAATGKRKSAFAASSRGSSFARPGGFRGK